MYTECEGFTFFSDFDSGNLGRVEMKVAPPNYDHNSGLRDYYEFILWTKPDCAETEYENTNRSWFYFGIKANGKTSTTVRLNVTNLNKLSKMYQQGMAPVYKIVPYGPASMPAGEWSRVDDPISFDAAENRLTFAYDTPRNPEAIVYFAFTYPFSLEHFRKWLTALEGKSGVKNGFYYHRECMTESLEGRKVDLITITSYDGITTLREPRFKGLFPDENTPRPFQFIGKKVIVISARVHPGETPSSFVMNGILRHLTGKDATAVASRKLYVFKLVPMLNPDGVSLGFYRTDTRGANLNRFYLNPSPELHPTIFALKCLILFHHLGHDDFDVCEDTEELDREEGMRDLGAEGDGNGENVIGDGNDDKYPRGMEESMEGNNFDDKLVDEFPVEDKNKGAESIKRGNIFLFADLHGHASKRGIFMFGNHFDEMKDKIECMLLPKLLSINNENFHYSACNFTERNMYIKDRRDGLSKEGSARVAVMKCTGLVRSYTLECNYNTGYVVNILPPLHKSKGGGRRNLHGKTLVPPPYTPQIFEEVGRALCISILDITGHNPNSRIPASRYKSMSGLRDSIKWDVCCADKSVAPFGRHSSPDPLPTERRRPTQPSSAACKGNFSKKRKRKTVTMPPKRRRSSGKSKVAKETDKNERMSSG